MKNNQFREEMEKYRWEREAFIKQLVPEDQQDYRQKEDKFNLKRSKGSNQPPTSSGPMVSNQ